jgi:hypothetical protein
MDEDPPVPPEVVKATMDAEVGPPPVIVTPADMNAALAFDRRTFSIYVRTVKDLYDNAAAAQAQQSASKEETK